MLFFWLGRHTGFDFVSHIEVINTIGWQTINYPIRLYFYGYHPPLAFFLVKPLVAIGMKPGMAVQVLDGLCLIAGFLLFRETLKRMRILREPIGVIFLYATFCVPVVIFMGHSANLESPLLVFTILALWSCVVLFWPGNTAKETRWPMVAVAIIALAAGLYTKYSGATNLIIPPLCAVAFFRKKLLRNIALASLIVGAAIALAAPYYYYRYYVHLGRLTPTNVEMRPGALEMRREARDRDPIGFVLQMVGPPTHLWEKGYATRDYSTIRLADAWRDFWLRVEYLGAPDMFSYAVGVALFWLCALLLLIGTGVFIWNDHSGDWYRLGLITIGLSLFHCAAFVSYLYQYPFPGWGPTKGLYLSTVIPGMVFLLVTPLTLARRITPTQVACTVTFLILLSHFAISY